MRERVQVEQGFWDWKRENVLPEIMREQGVDLWIIRNNEEPLYRMTSYKEHPVFTSLLPANHEGMVLPSSVAKSSMDVPEFLFYVIVYLVKQDTKNYDDFFFFFLPLGEGVSRSFFEG